MFTLKFVQKLADGEKSKDQKTSVISSKSYTIVGDNCSGADVSILVSDPQTGGEYNIGASSSCSFSHCFIENQAGKTIARFGKF